MSSAELFKKHFGEKNQEDLIGRMLLKITKAFNSP